MINQTPTRSMYCLLARLLEGDLGGGPRIRRPKNEQ